MKDAASRDEDNDACSSSAEPMPESRRQAQKVNANRLSSGTHTASMRRYRRDNPASGLICIIIGQIATDFDLV